jgi:hypothetical protein
LGPPFPHPRYSRGQASVKRTIQHRVPLRDAAMRVLVSEFVGGKKWFCKPLKLLFVSLIWGPLGDVNKINKLLQTHHRISALWGE